MPQDMLGDIDTGDIVQVAGSGMTKKPGMKLFMDAFMVCGVSEQILEGSRGYPFVSFCYEKRAFFVLDCPKIFRHNAADAVG
jgi:hypothetical protein